MSDNGNSNESTSKDKDKGIPKRNKDQDIIVYQFNDQIGDFEELVIDKGMPLKELLDDDFILLFVDPKHYRVWLWQGYNTTTRMKFLAAKMAQPIRDKHFVFAASRITESLDLIAEISSSQ